MTKTIVLQSLRIVNFKGIRDLFVNFGHRNNGFGDNGTGKTTVYDAALWLLFDKDSANKKDFGIKPTDENNKVIPGLNPDVEGTFVINGRQLVFRKVYSEQWTKKRGSADKEFTGHTTDYFVDGVPVKLKEYKARVDEVGDENIFKLLTNRAYFNEVLDWKARREILLEVAGDVSDMDVIQSNAKLSKLPAILGSHSIDDLRKIIAAKRKEVNEQLENIPVRIDEAHRSKPDVSGLSESELTAQITQLQTDIELKEMELSRIQSGGEVSVQEKCLREIEGELIAIKNRVQDGSLTAVQRQRSRLLDIESVINHIALEIRNAENRISSNNSAIFSKKDEASRLREQWTRTNEETFQSAHDDHCSACGQALPAEQVEAAHAKALEIFNLRKSEQLERIGLNGKRLMAEATKLEQENAELQAVIQKKTGERETEQLLFASVQKELEQLQASVQDVAKDPAYIAKLAEKENVEVKLSNLRNSYQSDLDCVRLTIIDLRTELRAVETKKAAFGQIITLDKRIDELQQQERKLAEEYEKLEEQLYMTEEFIKSKVNLLESKINNKFKYARFKLFETQINGGVQPTCQTLYKGIAYGAGLNNAACINVGLDIINTLSQHYGISAPIFVDNAEGVQHLVETDSQMIKLNVPTSFENLPEDVKQRLATLYEGYEKAQKAWEEQGKQLRFETNQDSVGEAM